MYFWYVPQLAAYGMLFVLLSALVIYKTTDNSDIEGWKLTCSNIMNGLHAYLISTKTHCEKQTAITESTVVPENILSTGSFNPRSIASRSFARVTTAGGAPIVIKPAHLYDKSAHIRIKFNDETDYDTAQLTFRSRSDSPRITLKEHDASPINWK